MAVAESTFSVSETLNNMTTLVNAAWDVIVSNPVLVICVGSLLIGVGFGVFRKAKSAATH